MRIVVAGGNGFIGSHFVAAAVSKGHKVTVVGHRASPVVPHGRTFEFLPGGLLALSEAPELLARTDIVCHFASNSIPASSNENPAADIEDNLVGTVRLLEAMRKTGSRRLLFLSSGGAIYGRPQTTPINEDHPLNPMSSYGVVKLAIEKYLRMYQENYGFSPIVIRLANPYGPGQTNLGQLGAVNTFLHLALNGEIATLWGDGSTVRDFVYVSDVTSLMLAAVESEVTGTFNCGAGVGTSLLALIALIEKTTGKVLQKQFGQPRPFDPPEVVLDVTRARETFGWQPRVPLAEGIDLTLRG